MLVTIKRDSEVSVIISGAVYRTKNIVIYEDGYRMYDNENLPKLLLYDAVKVKLEWKDGGLELSVRLGDSCE